MTTIRSKLRSFVAACLVVLPMLTAHFVLPVAVVCAASCGVVGCQSAARNSYNTLAIVGGTVSNATDGWLRYERAERLRLEQLGDAAGLAKLSENDAKVARLYGQFAAAYSAAVAASRLGDQGASDANLARLSAELVQAVAAFAK